MLYSVKRVSGLALLCCLIVLFCTTALVHNPIIAFLAVYMFLLGCRKVRKR
jgi:hypothetical protein